MKNKIKFETFVFPPTKRMKTGDFNNYLSRKEQCAKLNQKKRKEGLSWQEEDYRVELQDLIRTTRRVLKGAKSKPHYRVTITDKALREGVGESLDRSMALRCARDSLQRKRSQSRPFYDDSSYPAPRVPVAFRKPGWIMQMLMARRVESMLHRHPQPEATERHVGIEIECYIPHQERASVHDSDRAFIARELAKCGVPGGCVNIGRDGSLDNENDEQQGYELRVLVTESQLEKILPRICKALHNLDATVDITCGLHVHIDCRERSPETTYSRLYKALPLLYAVVPPSRHENRYCMRNRAAEMHDHRSGRYYAVNPDAYQNHRTIEVRLHSGSINALKIINWVRLLLSIADSERHFSQRTRSLRVWKRALSLSQQLVDFIIDRATKFKQSTIILNIPRSSVNVTVEDEPGEVFELDSFLRQDEEEDEDYDIAM